MRHANKKSKKEKLPRKSSYIPAKHRALQMQTIQMLPDWRGVSFLDPFDKDGVTIHRIVGPDKKVYRYAQSWEQPDVLIQSEILPADRDIRLVRERSKSLRIMVKRTLRRRLKLERR